MKQVLENPRQIEEMSLSILTSKIGEHKYTDKELEVVKRVVHATADFDFCENMVFSKGVVEAAISSIRAGISIITDVNMVKAGINKRVTRYFGCKVVCYISDEDVIANSKRMGITRARCAMRKAKAEMQGSIVVVGNAPMALFEVLDIVKQYGITPSVIIGVPVGFVNVVEAKDALLKSGVPCIVAKGRKGGTPVAVSIVNALLYMVMKEENMDRW